MLITNTENSTLKTEPMSLRRLLLLCLLPASLLVATPLAQSFLSALHHQTGAHRSEVPGAPTTMQEDHRRAALKTVEHLEAKASGAKGTGTPTITLLDLRRLRNALK